MQVLRGGGRRRRRRRVVSVDGHAGPVGVGVLLGLVAGRSLAIDGHISLSLSLTRARLRSHSPPRERSSPTEVEGVVLPAVRGRLRLLARARARVCVCQRVRACVEVDCKESLQRINTRRETPPLLNMCRKKFEPAKAEVFFRRNLKTMHAKSRLA